MWGLLSHAFVLGLGMHEILWAPLVHEIFGVHESEVLCSSESSGAPAAEPHLVSKPNALGLHLSDVGTWAGSQTMGFRMLTPVEEPSAV